MVENVQPDLLITDMMMPKRSGFLVLENLRTSDDSQKSVMKIIMVTANEGNRHRRMPNNWAWMITFANRLRWTACWTVCKADRPSEELSELAI